MTSLHSDTASSSRCCRLRRDAPGRGNAPEARRGGAGGGSPSLDPCGFLGSGGRVSRGNGAGVGEEEVGMNGLRRMDGGGERLERRERWTGEKDEEGEKD